MPTKNANVILITGAAKRIGAAIAKTFHRHGHQVIIHFNHSEKEAHSLVDYFNKIRQDSAIAIQANLNVPEQIEQLISDSVSWYGELHGLVNNASIFCKSSRTNTDLSNWQALFDTNVKAPYHLSIMAYHHLAKQQGFIVNLSDIHAEKPLKGYEVYCQSKAALNMQTKSLAQAFAPQVRVNAVAPGAIIWPEGTNELCSTDKDKIIHKTPLKQHGHPSYIANAVWQLACNAFITGTVLPVDGGRHLS